MYIREVIVCYRCSMTSASVSVNSQGRVYLPTHLREEVGLVSGSNAVAYVEGGRLVLEPRQHLLAQLQDEFLALTRGGDPVAELLEERRAEGVRERGERE